MTHNAVDARSELVTGVNHVGLTVTDLERSVEFYTTYFGCETVMCQEIHGGYLAEIVGYPGATVKMAHLRLPGSNHRLELFEYITPKSTPRDLEPRNVGNAHICFVVTELGPVYEMLAERGVATFSPPIDIDAGANAGGASLYCRDPDGITIEVFQPAR